jgi:hypothetical protein
LPSLVVQLNGLAIAVGQERAADNRVIVVRKTELLHPFKVPRAESSVRSMAEAVAQFPTKSCSKTPGDSPGAKVGLLGADE